MANRLHIRCASVEFPLADACWWIGSCEVGNLGKTEKLIAEWVALANRKDSPELVRGYATRYQLPEIDTERARREAAAAGELAERFMSERHGWATADASGRPLRRSLLLRHHVRCPQYGIRSDDHSGTPSAPVSRS